MIHVSPQFKAVVVPYTGAIANMFPSVPKLDEGGVTHSVLPHTEEITKFLRAEGMTIPAPIASRYDWEGGTPYRVQIETASMLTVQKRAYVLNGLGTGKTKSALWAWRYLNREGRSKRMLVVCPLSTMKFVWGAEIFRTLPGVKVAILHGSAARRRELLADKSYDIYIVNHHGLKIIAGELQSRDDINVMCIDELSVYRNGGSDLSKMAREVARRFPYVWGLTGQPTPNGPENAWGLAQVVRPQDAPRYFKHWRDEVMVRVSQFRYVPKRDALDRVHNLLQPAVRFSLDDVIELPDIVWRDVPVDMGPQQRKVYDAIEREAHIAFTTGEVTAVNAGAVLNKLLQISTGYVYLSDGSAVTLDADERLDACVDLIMGTERKVLVFAPFKHTLAGVVEKLRKEGIDCAQVSGDTPKGQRDEIFHAFQNTSQYTVLAAHPNCIAHGLTLTAADTIIWFGPILDFDIFDQANHRIRRIGQKHKQQIFMLQASKVERKAYTALMSKKSMNEILLDMFERNTSHVLTQ